MSSRTARVRPLTTVLTFTLLLGASGTPALTLEVGPSSVDVESATAGGSVALFALVSEWTGSSTHRGRRAELLPDADADGAVSWSLDSPPPTTSVWAAVDLVTGEVALAGPEGARVNQVPVPAVAPLASGSEIELSGRSLDAWWVRPGRTADSGAWRAALGDGAAADLDGVYDGVLRIAPASFLPLASLASPPASWAAGDVLIGVDTETLDHWVVVIGEEVR